MARAVPGEPAAVAVAVPGGQIERVALPGGPGVPLVVLGGVETGLRHLAGTERVLAGRWQRRTEARPVTVVGRPIPDGPADFDRLLHPRGAAAAAAAAVRDIGRPAAIEAESGGGRIALWLAVDHPDLVERLVLASVAAETPAGSPMAERLAQWIELAEAGRWGEFFGRMVAVMQPGDPSASGGSFEAAARLAPRPATPERFVAELRATLDPSSFVTEHLPSIEVPALVLAGGGDRVVPAEVTRAVAARMPAARFEIDPECGHTVRASFRGYHELVEAFLAEGDRS